MVVSLLAFTFLAVMDHIQLICDIGELNEVFTDARSIESFLQKIVAMVAKHMHAAVCSVYLYNEDRAELVLTATVGLNPDSIGKVRMKPGEGLTGIALKELRPVNVSAAGSHPGFRHFPGIDEERYDAFLAVPIVRGISRIGVLVVQRSRTHAFGDRDVMTLRAVASQLANMVENARLFMTLNVSAPVPAEKKGLRNLKLLKGKVASEGFAQGPVRIINREKTFDSFLHRTFSKPYSLADFDAAVVKTAHQLEELQKRVEEKLSDVASLIFTAHLLLLKDKEFIGTMARRMESGANPPVAVLSVAKHYVDLFNQGTSAYIREKVQDIEDLTIRLLGNLVEELQYVYTCDNHIIVGQELFPSDILRLSSESALGVVLVTGGVTSHLSILARSLRLPMVIIDSPQLLSLPDETPVLLDAEVGNLYIHPGASILSSFTARNDAWKSIKSRVTKVKPQTHTSDGVRIKLLANINLLSDLSLAREVNCEGVGLYRTEFPFMVRNDFPSEEEQYAVYRQLVTGLAGKKITFRTLDIGGDKILSYYNSVPEHNPFLGMRSIRFSLANIELFAQQIRAMLRAGADGDIRIGFPMISSVEEFVESRRIVTTCMEELRRKRLPHNSTPEIGIMVEVPSVVQLIDEFAGNADFFSIGTNDLVQYMLAVDRTNEKVASLYNPNHPSVLRAIAAIAEAAIKAGKDVSVCGDMAHQERFLPFFIGIGIRELSLEPSSIPRVQDAISRIDESEARAKAHALRACGTISEVMKLIGSAK